MRTTQPQRSELLEAVGNLAATPARTLRNPETLKFPTAMTSDDAQRCTDLAKDNRSIAFLRDDDASATGSILSTLREAWKRDKLPALAICASEASASAVRQATGIESVRAEDFLGDLALARRVTQTFTGRKNFVIGHDYNPKGRFDQIVLPSQAQVVVHQADRLSADELTTICKHASQVGGRVIFCADVQALQRAHAEIALTMREVFPYAGLERNDERGRDKTWAPGDEPARRSTSDQSLPPESGDSKPWVIVANCWWEIGANCVRSVHASQEDALHAVPAAFAEEWKDYVFFHQADWTDRDPPSVSVAQWRVPTRPEIGDRVRIANHAVVSMISLDERFPIPEEHRPDTRESDPLANTRSFLVFHANTGDARRFPADFTLVARVEAESFDHAAFLARQAESLGTDHPGVTRFVENPRSIQVGDVIVDHDVPKQYVGRGWRLATTLMEPASARVARPDMKHESPQPEPPEPEVRSYKLKF